MNREEKFIDVNGAQVMDLTPDMQRKLALVDLDVLVKITSHLGKGNMRSIKRGLTSELNEIENYSNENCLKELVHICSEFVAFHNTVNLIQEIKHPMNVTKHQLDDKPVTGTNIDEV